jgi:hypothetical protein
VPLRFNANPNANASAIAIEKEPLVLAILAHQLAAGVAPAVLDNARIARVLFRVFGPGVEVPISPLLSHKATPSPRRVARARAEKREQRALLVLLLDGSGA